MSSAVSGYKRAGADAPPACYEDLELADTVLIAGSNMAYAHPVLFRRLEAARARRPGMKLIVVDPRRTDTASGADLHLPLTPGSDVALFHAMLNVMVWEGLVDQDYISAHTSGFGRSRPASMNSRPARPPRSAAFPRGTSSRPRAGSAARRCLVAAHHGPEPVGQRHRQEHRADPSAPGHGPDRQAGRGPSR